jgi:phosphoribosylanthranilate isomerase
MTAIKICGITNVDDAFAAAQAGVDLLGFIFYPKSPRYVPPETAAFIAGAVRGSLGVHRPRFVGVFVDEPVTRVRRLLDAVGLDLAQLHGNEPPTEVRELSPRAFKAIRPQTQTEAQAALDAYRGSVPDDARQPQLLVDAYHPQQLGGTGHKASVSVARWLQGHVRLLLAGGLTPDNVHTAVEQIRPWGVDVSSGVERRPGAKDPARIRAFVQAVRSVDDSGRVAEKRPSLPRVRDSRARSPEKSHP